VDDVVADIIDGPGSSDSSDSSSSSATQQQPVLRPSQHRMVVSLNALPKMKKHFAFIHPLTNAHGTIIARDVKQFEFHRRGEGVLRHLADHFELE